MIHSGGCHCGAVRFEVEAAADVMATECNCSICSKSGYLHLIVPRADFRLLQGEDKLVSYSFDTHEAKHLFCGICGIKSFYIPRSHPEGVSVNVRCLDDSTLHSVQITPFDGRNWEDNIGSLKPLPE